MFIIQKISNLRNASIKLNCMEIAGPVEMQIRAKNKTWTLKNVSESAEKIQTRNFISLQENLILFKLTIVPTKFRVYSADLIWVNSSAKN